MPSSYTTSLRLTLPATGELSGTWGTTVNTGITELTDAAIAGYVSIAMTDADYTLTVANGATDQARRMMLNMTGTLSAARNVICPTASKLYVIKNATTGGFAITLKTSGGTGISIPNGQSMLLMCDGTNVVDAVTQFSSGAFTNLSYTGTLTGGTGVVNLGSGQFYKDASGNVGIGTSSPGTLLHGSSGRSILTWNSTTTNNDAMIALTNSTDSSRAEILANKDGTGGATYLALGTRNTSGSTIERMRLDASGNLGLGVTPSAWNTSFYTALQVGAGASLFGSKSSAAVAWMGANTFFNSSNSNTYIATAAATQYRQNAGEHAWFTAPSGTAGNAISFTQAMTLDASGNLGIGTAAPNWVGVSTMLSVNGASTSAVGTKVADAGALYLSSGSTYSAITELRAQPLSFGTNNTERARITSGGDLLVGQTGGGPLNLNGVGIAPGTTGGTDYNHANGTASGVMYERFNYNATTIGSITQSGTTAVLYNTTSDARLKTNIVDAPEASTLIDSIKVRSFDWTSDESHQRYGMVAQELVQVAPEAVHQPEDPGAMMAVDYSKLVPMLIKEIQSLRARVAALEAA